MLFIFRDEDDLASIFEIEEDSGDDKIFVEEDDSDDNMGELSMVTYRG